MTDYKVISHSQVAQFTADVKAAIAEGWQPLGGMSSNNFFYTQALIKPDPVVPVIEYKLLTDAEKKDLREKIEKEYTGPVKRSHKKKVTPENNPE